MVVVVPKLQEMLLGVVPMRDLIRYNLTHLLGVENRFVRDLEEGGVGPVPHWFLRVLLDTGETSFYWFRGFIRKKASWLPLNEAVFVGSQDRYKETHSLCVFAARVSGTGLVVFVYSNPMVEKYGIPCSRPLTPRITQHGLSSTWSTEDWACLSCLELDCAFKVSLSLTCSTTQGFSNQSR